MVSSETVGRMQLDEFVDAIPRIYHEKDVKRSIWDVWMHTNHHASAIGEEVRKGNSGRNLLIEIADFAIWLFSVVNKCRGEIGVRIGSESEQETLIRIAHGYSDLVWNKFPGLCPACYWRRTKGNRERKRHAGFSKPCDCLLHDVETGDQKQTRQHTRALRAFSREQHANKPEGIDEWQNMFRRIFEAALRHLSAASIAFHLLEGMGKVSDAMARMYTYTDSSFVAGEPSWRQIRLEDEFANVSSWLFVLVEKLETIRQNTDDYELWLSGRYVEHKHITLSEIIWKRYGSDELKEFICPHPPPKQVVCTCPVILIPADRSVKDVQDRLTDVLGL